MDYKILTFIIFNYFALTLSEWFLHKYVMHAKPNTIFYTKQWGQSHLDHHKEVDNNNSIKFKEPKGLIFAWYPTLVIMFSYYLALLAVINKLVGTNFKITTLLIIALIVALIYSMLWNSIHAAFHDTVFSYDITVGFPSFQLDPTIKHNFIMRWLWRNHVYHHLNKGDKKGNFNIIIPGGDHIMGTYRDSIDNNDYCQNEGPTDAKTKEICEHPPKIENLAKKMEFN